MDPHRVIFGIADKHINSGIAWNCERCPGALAILDRVSAEVSVSLDEYLVSFVYSSAGNTLEEGSRQRYCQVVPEELCDFTYRYDRMQKGVPIEFVLDVPEWAYCPERADYFRMTKSLVRVSAVNRNQCWIDVVVPGWHHAEKIRLMKDVLPEDVFLAAAPEKKFHAWVNITNNLKAELFFADWENA